MAEVILPEDITASHTREEKSDFKLRGRLATEALSDVFNEVNETLRIMCAKAIEKDEDCDESDLVHKLVNNIASARMALSAACVNQAYLKAEKSAPEWLEIETSRAALFSAMRLPHRPSELFAAMRDTLKPFVTKTYMDNPAP